jgi:hypothetical protein
MPNAHRSSRVAAALILLAVLAAGCAPAGSSTSPPEPSPAALPAPTCGGLKVAVPGALPCADVVTIAIRTLGERSPDQLARGVRAIDVVLAQCPAGEVPPQIDCADEPFAQMVTVTFADPVQGGLIEPSLTVAVAPASGRVLGVSNPLIR